MKYRSVTGGVIKCFYNVYNQLGYGFLEKVYERSLVIELRKYGLVCEKQFPITVFYDDVQVGKYYADILVDRSVIVELKATTLLLEEY